VAVFDQRRAYDQFGARQWSHWARLQSIMAGLL
jgi:hypothetical protein